MGGIEGKPKPGGAQIVRPGAGDLQGQPAFTSVSSVTPSESADAASPEEASRPGHDGEDDRLLGAEDDGLVGDGVCAHPTTNAVPTTTARARARRAQTLKTPSSTEDGMTSVRWALSNAQ